MFLVLTSGKLLAALGSGIGTGLVFCLSFSVLNNLYSVPSKRDQIPVTIAAQNTFKTYFVLKIKTL